jgi:hypothetical protein
LDTSTSAPANQASPRKPAPPQQQQQQQQQQGQQQGQGQGQGQQQQQQRKQQQGQPRPAKAGGAGAPVTLQPLGQCGALAILAITSLGIMLLACVVMMGVSLHHPGSCVDCGQLPAGARARVVALYNKILVTTEGKCLFNIMTATTMPGDLRLMPWVHHDMKLVDTWQQHQVEFNTGWAHTQKQLASLVDIHHESFDMCSADRDSCSNRLPVARAQLVTTSVQWWHQTLSNAQLQYARTAAYVQLLQELNQAGLCDKVDGYQTAEATPLATAAAEAGTRRDRARQEVQDVLPEYQYRVAVWRKIVQEANNVTHPQDLHLDQLLNSWLTPDQILRPEY